MSNFVKILTVPIVVLMPILAFGQQVVRDLSTVSSDSIFFVTHATSETDFSSSVKQELETNVTDAKKFGTAVMYLVNPNDDPMLYYLKNIPDYIYNSNDGSMNLVFNSDKFYFGGGYFNMCAGQTARDAFLYAKKSNIKAIYLADSLYVIRPNDENSSELGTISLKDVLKNLSDKNMIKFLRTNYFFYKQIGLDNVHDRHADFSKFTFNILRDGKKIGFVGQGSQVLEMNFIINGKVDFKNP